MAKETLVHSCMRFTRNGCGDHFKMAHIVAGRRLMALGAVQRSGRGMAEFRNRPGDGAVTLGAVLPEQAKVTIFISMTSGTVQYHFLRRQVGVPGCSFAFMLFDPILKVIANQAVFRLGVGVAYKLTLANAR